MAEEAPRKPQTGWWLTGGSLGALIAGIVAGAWAHGSSSPAATQLVATFAPVGTLWVDALRMTILPLVVSQLVVAVASARGRAVGRLGLLSVSVFVALLTLAGVFTILAGPPIIERLAPLPGALAGLQPYQPAGPPRTAPDGASEWLAGLVPTNPIRAAAQDDLLPVIVFTVLFALALTQVRAEGRRAALLVFQAIAEAMLVLVGWIMAAAPVGVFALALTLAASTGLQTAHVLLSFVAVVCILLAAFTVALYPLAVLVGRVPLGRFCRALIPAQVVALSTRSSLASLPTLLEGAERRLRLQTSVSGFVLPLSVSTFKVNRTISSPAKLLFLAYLYNIDLSPAQIGSFLLAVLIMSFSTVGIPNGGSSLKTLPFYVAAGIPVEGAVIFEAVEAIPDMFKTLLNVTGNMTAATVVARFAPESEPAFADQPAAVGSPAAAL